jgi:hypothetical protein
MTSSWLINAEWLYAVLFKHFEDLSAADASLWCRRWRRSVTTVFGMFS